MKHITLTISTIMLALLVSSFQLDKGGRKIAVAAVTIPVNDSALECNEVYEYFYTTSPRYRQYCDTLYNSLFSKGHQPSRKVFDYAMKGYAYFSSQDLLAKKDLLAFIDYSLSSNVKRLWVIDLRQKSLIYHELVAHGRNTGMEYARKFSNKGNSFQTSLGFFITGEIYNGKHELSVKMNGMERKFNGNAFDRGIVMHGADYVSEQYIRQNQRLGRSLGCPAVSQEVISRLSSTISDGVCLFAYYPNKSYLKYSKVLQSDVVMAVAK
jgi:hypothetical protein